MAYVGTRLAFDILIPVWHSKCKHHFIVWLYYFLKITLFCCYFILNLYYLQVFIMGENKNIWTVKDLKTYLDDKINKLASSESISDIKALVQEQSNLILELTETVNSPKKIIDKLEESLTECKNSLEVSKTVSSRLVKKCGRRLCLRILDACIDR